MLSTKAEVERHKTATLSDQVKLTDQLGKCSGHKNSGRTMLGFAEKKGPKHLERSTSHAEAHKRKEEGGPGSLFRGT